MPSGTRGAGRPTDGRSQGGQLVQSAMAVELGSDVQRGIRPVAADEWVSVADAARMLGTPPHRVGNLIANGHLVAATSASDDLGTTSAPIEREVVWRRETTWWRKARRAVGDAMNWI